MNLIRKILHKRLSVFVLLIFLILINWTASIWHVRFDLTAEKRFTLSHSTQKFLRSIKNPVEINVFLKGDFPSGFRKLASGTEDILREFKDITGNKIHYRFIAPEELIEGTNSTYADTLTSMGLFPINLTAQLKNGQQQQNVFPAAIITYENKTVSVLLYKGKTPLINFQELNDAEAQLEYNFAHAIAQLTQNEKPKIAYAAGNDEPLDVRVFDLAEQTLKPNYDLSLVNIQTQPFISNEFKALLIVKPTTPFTVYEKLKIDQYIMNGGKVLFFLDKLDAEMDSLQIKNEVIAYDRQLNIDDQLFKYGARINPDLVMDLQCDYLPFDVNGNGQFEFLPWNYFPVFESLNNHPINKNIGFISGKFVNSIDTIETENIKKTILLSSSVNARKIGTPALISGKENVTAPEHEKYKTAHIPVAVLLEGKFKSFFSNRLSAELNDSLVNAGMDFKSFCNKNNQIIVVADGDILLNTVAKGNQPLPMGMNPFTYGSQREFPFANKDFILNALDYLVSENNLSEAKSKDYVVRLLDIKKLNESKNYWQLFNILTPMLLVLIFAFVFQWFRKRKYTK